MGIVFLELDDKSKSNSTENNRLTGLQVLRRVMCVANTSPALVKPALKLFVVNYGGTLYNVNHFNTYNNRTTLPDTLFN